MHQHQSSPTITEKLPFQVAVTISGIAEYPNCSCLSLSSCVCVFGSLCCSLLPDGEKHQSVHFTSAFLSDAHLHPVSKYCLIAPVALHHPNALMVTRQRAIFAVAGVTTCSRNRLHKQLLSGGPSWTHPKPHVSCTL